MLVLSVYTGNRVRLRLPDGTVIWVGLATTGRDQAKLGFEAPTWVEIKREELLKEEDRHG